MASKNTTNTTASKNGRQRIERSNSDSARWIAGLLLLFVGVFAASSVLFSFFSWAADQSGLQKSVEERVPLGIEPEDLCGWAGAAKTEQDLLVCMVTDTLLASLTVTSLFAMPVTRFLADMLYEEQEQLVLPSFWGANALLLAG